MHGVMLVVWKDVVEVVCVGKIYGSSMRVLIVARQAKICVPFSHFSLFE